MSDYEARFGGIARLYGMEGLKRLSKARVCVIGLGGGGCWVVEALALNIGYAKDKPAKKKGGRFVPN